MRKEIEMISNFIFLFYFYKFMNSNEILEELKREEASVEKNELSEYEKNNKKK